MSYFQKIIIVFFFLAIALTPPILIMYMALSHNPQNEYMDPSGEIEWYRIFFLVIPGLFIGIMIATGVVTITLFIIKLIMQHKAHGRKFWN